MNRYEKLAITFAMAAALVLVCSQSSSAQANLTKGTVVQRADIPGSGGKEAILVMRELPPGVESGKHTQSGTEIVYILEGSVIFEAAGQPAKTLKAGEAFKTTAGEVHNVKNASKTEPTKALAFYIAKKGTQLDDLSKPVK